jgi:uncharacterized protein YecT (DUF1311 family)
MNRNIILSLLVMALCFNAFCQTSEQFVKLADKAFDSGEKGKAKELYLKAAAMNNAEAHFDIAYKFIVTHEESVFHFSEAAKSGHKEALEYALDELFFRANSLTEANPEYAYEIYKAAKKINPTLEIYDEETKVLTLERCIEADPFDAKTFIKEYDIKDTELDDAYGIWELAAEASRGVRFGTPNPKLVLQLVSRGGSVPAELESAVDVAYKNWKANTVFEFNVCDYVGSGFGLSYCSAKAEEEANKEYLGRLKKLSSQLKNGAGETLMNTFNVASRFIEEKAWHEELHGGSGYAAWTRESIMQQKKEYLDLIEKINSFYGRDSIIAIGDSDKMLNQIYQIVIDTLKNSPITSFNAEVKASGLRSVQRLWIKYRDSSALLFSQIDPSVSKQQWNNWLTAVRVKELREILAMAEEMR